jgi:serine/threonine protein kinase
MHSSMHRADTKRPYSAATNAQTGEGVAIKKITNVFSKKILAKRALREIKLLQHFRGHRNVCSLEALINFEPLLMCFQITCLYDMDIPRPEIFNECYLYEGEHDRHTSVDIPDKY